MRRLHLVAATSLAATLCGCMPLEQAPLVYSSKNQIGVGVAAGTPDSPGLDINIGYKGLDAAFVPVAVAKHCTPATGTDCGKVDYGISFVKGGNKLSGQSIIDNQLLQQYQSGIDAADAQIAETSLQISQKTAQIAALAKLPDMLKRQTELAATADPATGAAIVRTPAEITEKTKLDADIAQLQKGGTDMAALQQDVSRLSALNQATATKQADIKTLRADLLARKDVKSGDDKDDALSVYGSFNGDASGTKDGAGLKLGKVFSTGIAAQNITQGIRNSARTDAVTNCLKTAKDVLGTSTDATAIAAAISVCKVPDKEQD